MRVTANTVPNSLPQQITSLTQRQNKLQTQTATGQIVQLPEDAPVAMRRSLDMQAEGKAVGQFQRNLVCHQELAADEDNFLFHLGTNGAIQSRLEATNAIANRRSGTLEALVSKEADADLAETLVRLNQTQTAYQAALQSAGKSLGSSLLDYLR